MRCALYAKKSHARHLFIGRESRTSPEAGLLRGSCGNHLKHSVVGPRRGHGRTQSKQPLHWEKINAQHTQSLWIASRASSTAAQCIEVARPAFNRQCTSTHILHAIWNFAQVTLAPQHPSLEPILLPSFMGFRQGSPRVHCQVEAGCDVPSFGLSITTSGSKSANLRHALRHRL